MAYGCGLGMGTNLKEMLDSNSYATHAMIINSSETNTYIRVRDHEVIYQVSLSMNSIKDL